MTTEEELIEHAKTDPNAFGELYDRYYGKIFNYSFRVTGNYQVACDIAGETFAKAFMRINSFKWKGISISSWLFKIATNELNQYFRRKRYSPYSLAAVGPDVVAGGLKTFSDESNETIGAIYMTETFRTVQQALQRLPPDYQKVIALKYYENLSIREISEILGRKEGTIKSLLSRAIERLRKAL